LPVTPPFAKGVDLPRTKARITPAVVDVPSLRILLAALVGWLDRQP